MDEIMQALFDAYLNPRPIQVDEMGKPKSQVAREMASMIGVNEDITMSPGVSNMKATTPDTGARGNNYKLIEGPVMGNSGWGGFGGGM